RSPKINAHGFPAKIFQRERPSIEQRQCKRGSLFGDQRGLNVTCVTCKPVRQKPDDSSHDGDDNAQPDPGLGKHQCYVLSFVIIRIIRNIPTGHASKATILTKPLPTSASEPNAAPRNGMAAKSSSGAAQQTTIMSMPLSVLFFCSCGASVVWSDAIRGA